QPRLRRLAHARPRRVPRRFRYARRRERRTRLVPCSQFRSQSGRPVSGERRAASGRRRAASGQRVMSIRGVRWWIVGLVFLATFINFLDRLTVSVLAPVITSDLGLTNLQFATISTWFLAAYTASQGLSGRLYDIVGTRRGFAGSVVIWS